MAPIERSFQVGILLKGGREGNGIFHGKFGAGANGEMGGMYGVAQQYDVAMMPCLRLERGEANPF